MNIKSIAIVLAGAAAGFAASSYLGGSRNTVV
jgi:hypothetical protein